MAGLIQQYKNVIPTPYSTGLPLLASMGIGVAVVGAASLAAWYFAPGTVKGLLGVGEAAEDGEANANPLEEGDDAIDEEEDTGEPAIPDATEVQSLLFSKQAGWTVPKARAWVKRHSYHFGKVDVTADFIRARQAPPEQFAKGSFRTITFGKGIKAVTAKRG